MSSVDAVGAISQNAPLGADATLADAPAYEPVAADKPALSESDNEKQMGALSSPAGIAVRLLASLPEHLGQNSDIAV